MTDHKAEAENFLSAVIIPKGEPPEVYIGMAQVSATLYLAEQQRIANLIAYLAICEERGVADEKYLFLDTTVCEGLGL